MTERNGRKRRLDGKSAIITGATGGIGEATARLFLDEGAKVMLVGRSSEKLRATQERLNGGDSLAHFICDAADEAKIAAAIGETAKMFGGLDVMFANAGTEGRTKPLDQMSYAEFEDVLRTNVLGVFVAMKHAIAPMKTRGGGSIIATSSIAGQVGFASAGAYVASKHAVYGLVKSAAVELGPDGIRVNAVGPGPIDNRMIASIAQQLAPGEPDEFRKEMEATIPLRRYGVNEEVAKLVAFLASDDASYCSGGNYMVDGGYVAA